jgi:uracil phosphoribosyltransferase
VSRVYRIDDAGLISLANVVRNKETTRDDLKTALFLLGVLLSQKIISEFFTEERDIITPMENTIVGLLPRQPASVIVTTKADRETIGSGFAKSFTNGMLGHIDFHNQRGNEVMSSPVREIEIPEINNKRIECLVVLKSVLATGCTAISLTRSGLAICVPDRLVIASLFYSSQGLQELVDNFPNAYVFVVGSPDDANHQGLLVPGVGLLEERLGV